MKKILKLTSISIISTILFASCGSTATTTDDSQASSFDFERQISVVSREDGSGTRGAFIELFGIEQKDDDGNKVDHTTEEAIIVNTTDVVMKNVITDPYSIGYISLGSLNDTVKAVQIDGVDASSENIKNGSYTVSRPFNVATAKGVENDLVSDFMNFVLSDEGQSVVGQSYISVDSTGAFESTMPEGKIVVAGSSSVSPVMEKLIEAYKAINPNATIELQMSDSSTGLSQVSNGTADIGMASRDLKDSELENLDNTVIALDGIAVIVNPDSPVDNLSTDDVFNIYTGASTKWSDIISQ